MKQKFIRAESVWKKLDTDEKFRVVRVSKHEEPGMDTYFEVVLARMQAPGGWINVPITEFNKSYIEVRES